MIIIACIALAGCISSEEGRRIEPTSIVGCKVIKYGGYFGRGLPCPFYLGIEGESTVNLEEIPEDDPDAKIDYCEKQYAAQKLPCVFKLTDGEEDLMDRLVKRGYTDITPSSVMRAKVRDIKMPEGELVFSDHPTEEWLEPYFAFEGFDERHQGIYRRMLDKLCLKAVYAAVKKQGKVVAVASAVEDNGQMLIQNVIVDAAHRGKGYGKAVCTALLAKAAEDGIHTCFLQVLQRNTVAHSLYESLGFQQVYNYCYMKKE